MATSNLPIKGAALVFSVLLWLVVSADESTEAVIPVRVVLGLDSATALRSAVPLVQAVVVGRGRELLKLSARPPTLRRSIGSGITDSVRLELRPSDVSIPEGISAHVRELEPRAITVQLDATMQRPVPVRSALLLTPDSGLLIVGEPRFEPESVVIRGRRGAVRAIGAIATTPARLLVRSETPVTVSLDTAGLDVRVRPARVQMRVQLARAIQPETSTTSTRDTIGHPPP